MFDLNSNSLALRKTMSCIFFFFSEEVLRKVVCLGVKMVTE